MKKFGVVLVLLFVLPFLLAQSNSSNVTSPGSLDDDSSFRSKIDNGFACLEEEVGDCSGLSVKEKSLTILASPSRSVSDDCVTNLLRDGNSDGSFGSVLDTAFAILALDHAGEDTTDSQDWLLKQKRSPSDLQWFVQQDSSQRVTCDVRYSSFDDQVVIGDDKKIASDAGDCLPRSSSYFWFEVNPECYGLEFEFSCDKDFFASLLYKNAGSSTVYVLDETFDAPAYDSVSLKVVSSCFGSDSSCDYESTAWASFALLSTGNVVDEFVPYLVALSDTNKRFLPFAFLLLVSGNRDFADRLLEEQLVGGSWDAPGSSYSSVYDTSLALLSSSKLSSSDKIRLARDFVLFKQSSSTGCWSDSVVDTAMALWALEGRPGFSSSSGSSITRCSEAGFFCVEKSRCPSALDVGNNYFCSASTLLTCCKEEVLLTCDEEGGSVCSSDEVCSGNQVKTSDVGSVCCTGTCKPKPVVSDSECELRSGVCRSSCRSSEDSSSYACSDSGDVCCVVPLDDSKSGGYTWIIVLGVLILLVVLAIVFRERLKLWWFALRARFRKDNTPVSQLSRGPSSGVPPPGAFRPGVPPRGPPTPGFRPPMRRPPLPPRGPSSGVPSRSSDREMSDTFKRLKGFS